MQKTCERTCIHFRDVHLHTKHINTHTHTHTHMHTQVVGTVLQVSLQAVRAVTTPLLSRMTAWSLLPRSLQTLLLGGGAQGYVNPVLAASVALKFKRYVYDTPGVHARTRLECSVNHAMSACRVDGAQAQEVPGPIARDLPCPLPPYICVYM